MQSTSPFAHFDVAAEFVAAGKAGGVLRGEQIHRFSESSD